MLACKWHASAGLLRAGFGSSCVAVLLSPLLPLVLRTGGAILLKFSCSARCAQTTQRVLPP
jgi:hypothetical protein